MTGVIPRSLIAADRRHHTCLHDAREHCRPLQAARQVPGKKKLRVLNPILRLYRIQSTGKSFRMRVEMCWKWAWQSAARSASWEGGVCSKSVGRLYDGDAG